MGKNGLTDKQVVIDEDMKPLTMRMLWALAAWINPLYKKPTAVVGGRMNAFDMRDYGVMLQTVKALRERGLLWNPLPGMGDPMEYELTEEGAEMLSLFGVHIIN